MKILETSIRELDETHWAWRDIYSKKDREWIKKHQEMLNPEEDEYLICLYIDYEWIFYPIPVEPSVGERSYGDLYTVIDDLAERLEETIKERDELQNRVEDLERLSDEN